ncbi:hypothetical protein, partial [Roseiconus lacunae]|uniref:hypothetical protein n=1 Tax=Roseiconus lacunae TaxID=2605694 RepID=UPI001E6319BE
HKTTENVRNLSPSCLRPHARLELMPIRNKNHPSPEIAGKTISSPVCMPVSLFSFFCWKGFCVFTTIVLAYDDLRKEDPTEERLITKATSQTVENFEPGRLVHNTVCVVAVCMGKTRRMTKHTCNSKGAGGKLRLVVYC